MPPPCRSAGAARAPRNRSPQSRGPPTAAPRLHPAGAPHQPADGRLSELRLGPAAARLLTDADIAALFRRTGTDSELLGCGRLRGRPLPRLAGAGGRRRPPGYDAAGDFLRRRSSSPPAAPWTPTSEGPIRGGRYSLHPPLGPACICEATWMAA